MSICFNCVVPCSVRDLGDALCRELSANLQRTGDFRDYLLLCVDGASDAAPIVLEESLSLVCTSAFFSLHLIFQLRSRYQIGSYMSCSIGSNHRIEYIFDPTTKPSTNPFHPRRRTSPSLTRRRRSSSSTCAPSPRCCRDWTLPPTPPPPAAAAVGRRPANSPPAAAPTTTMTTTTLRPPPASGSLPTPPPRSHRPRRRRRTGRRRALRGPSRYAGPPLLWMRPRWRELGRESER
jgi:hypothetical protein